MFTKEFLLKVCIKLNEKRANKCYEFLDNQEIIFIFFKQKIFDVNYYFIFFIIFIIFAISIYFTKKV